MTVVRITVLYCTDSTVSVRDKNWKAPHSMAVPVHVYNLHACLLHRTLQTYWRTVLVKQTFFMVDACKRSLSIQLAESRSRGLYWTDTALTYWSKCESDFGADVATLYSTVQHCTVYSTIYDMVCMAWWWQLRRDMYRTVYCRGCLSMVSYGNVPSCTSCRLVRLFCTKTLACTVFACIVVQYRSVCINHRYLYSDDPALVIILIYYANAIDHQKLSPNPTTLNRENSVLW